jgi:hypothetical protein
VISRNAAVFVRDKPDPARERQLVEGIAAELQKVAKLVDDPDVRLSARQVGLSSKVSDFAGATVPDHGRRTAATQAFDGSYSGTWTDAKGTALDIQMTLRRQGQTVRGRYEFGLGSVELEGMVDGDHFDFAWRWGSEYFGRGRLRSAAGGQLQGTWGYTRRFEGGGTIAATRR